jgi:hypothetical protein
MKSVWAWFVASALVVLAGVLYIFRRNDKARRTISASVAYRQKTEIEKLKSKLDTAQAAEVEKIKANIEGRKSKIRKAFGNAGMAPGEIVRRMRNLSL